MSALEVRDLSKNFAIGGTLKRAHVHAVEDVSFSLQPGRITALEISPDCTAQSCTLWVAAVMRRKIVDVPTRSSAFAAVVPLLASRGYAAGPAGVGRAVNQAVVISFAAIWIFNYVFTTILLGVNPSMQIFK